MLSCIQNSWVVLRARTFAACGIASLLATSAIAGEPDADFKALMEEVWDYSLSRSPTFATSIGVRDFDDDLGDPSLDAYDEATKANSDFLGRLEAINRSGLSADQTLNYDLLRLSLLNRAEDAEHPGKFLYISNRNGPHTFLARLPTSLPFFTKADYESYVARLNDAPAFVAAAISRLQAGVDAGWTQACVPMAGYGKSIRFHLVDNVSDSVFFRPFEKKPTTISDRDWRNLRAAGEKAIEAAVIPAIRAFADFYDGAYAPSCRQDAGVSALPGGEDYYAHRARFYTTTSMTPDEIHSLGLSEVKRIRAEMEKIINAVEFEGDFEAFQEYLRTNEKFYAKSPEELLEKNAWAAKRADGQLTNLFTRLPRMPYTIKEIPADVAESTTTAYYSRPAGDGSRPGVYWVNTSKLETRPIYEIEALTLHEAVPGHHFQIALMQELDLPDFRKYAGQTAFIEGWGLYAEQLGLDIGFYQDPYSNFGRLSYEMWRACRLVVDTGIHAMGWTREQAIGFMAANTALSEHNVTAEVDRYISNPGQALAYKIGQLKFSELRGRAQKALGAKFDLRRFHDEALKDGAVPLSVLEAKMDAWIDAERDTR
ncbi:MAG: DUF885 family protein [Alphaproteobacteria bacterium]|nr:DUF885 family protein [Alphaproteobacteria bacterium]